MTEDTLYSRDPPKYVSGSRMTVTDAAALQKTLREMGTRASPAETKEEQMSKMKMKLASLLFITLLFSPHTVMAEFDPTLKAALATVIGQRDMTMNLVLDSHARARQIERDAFPGRLPQQVPEYGFCQNAASGRFDDMKVTYNRIIESIRNGTATESTIRTNTHDSVTINNALIDAARKCLLRNSLIDLNQTTIEEAWMKIFTSYKSMNEKDRKKLSKHLEKKVRWKTTR